MTVEPAMLNRGRHWTDLDQCHGESWQHDVRKLRQHPRALNVNDEGAMAIECDGPPEDLTGNGKSHLYEGT